MTSERFKESIIDLWKTHDAPDAAYFEKAEDEAWLSAIWGEGTVFQKRLADLDLSSAVEIACGAGRHATRLASRCGQLHLIDTSEAAIETARERFRDVPNIKLYLSTDGSTIPLTDSSATAVYSFDAMVHFEPATMSSYLAEIGRVLVPGGRALIHHSNYSENPTGTIHDVHGWRNYMTQDLFAHFSSRAELVVESVDVLNWAFVDSDALTMVRRKGASDS